MFYKRVGYAKTPWSFMTFMSGVHYYEIMLPYLIVSRVIVYFFKTNLFFTF